MPVTFITGSTGVFYKQFGLTLGIAILISAVNALTLSPALCALLLKPHHDSKLRTGFLQRFYAAFNSSFEAVTNKYKRSVSFLAKRKWIALAGIAAFAGLLVFLVKTTPGGFVPNEDQKFIMVDISLPPASSLERTSVISSQVAAICSSLPEIASVTQVGGLGLLSGGNGGSYAAFFMQLKPWDERKGADQSVESVINKLFGLTAHIKAANILFFAPPTLKDLAIRVALNSSYRIERAAISKSLYR